VIAPDEAWEARVMEDCLVWSEYGCPFDIRTALPRREYLAHLSILRGRNEKRKEQADEARRR